MEINNILQSDLLDIIFDGRNKAYGAYELRKTYNNRLLKAGLIILVLLSVLIAIYIFTNKFTKSDKPEEITAIVKLIEIEKVEPKPETIIPPKQEVQPPKTAMIKNVVPLIVRDELVAEKEMPPTNDELAEARIGPITTEGNKDEGLSAPALADGNKGIITPPVPETTDAEKIFLKVEVESQYPGGASAWMRYLNKTFRYPVEAQETNLQGTITVQFIVDADGNVSNVEAISGPEAGGLREEAVRVIKKSGKWEPAIQNGRKVKSYKKQPITFKLEVE